VFIFFPTIGWCGVARTSCTTCRPGRHHPHNRPVKVNRHLLRVSSRASDRRVSSITTPPRRCADQVAVGARPGELAISEQREKLNVSCSRSSTAHDRGVRSQVEGARRPAGGCSGPSQAAERTRKRAKVIPGRDGRSAQLGQGRSESPPIRHLQLATCNLPRCTEKNSTSSSVRSLVRGVRTTRRDADPDRFAGLRDGARRFPVAA